MNKAIPFPTQFPAFWYLALLGLFTFLSAAVFLTVLSHDPAWYLYASGEMLTGATLYQDIVDINPPLIFYLGVPPVWMSDLVAGSEITLFRIYLIFLVLLSLYLCRQSLKLIFQGTDSVQIRRCFLLVLLYVLMRPHFFGQREHLMFAFIMPYVLASSGWISGRILGRQTRFFIGLFAALGIALKPYFIFVWLMIELYVLYRTTLNSLWQRIENLVIIFVVGTYSGLVFIFSPEYHQTILPMALEFYGAFNSSASVLFGHSYVSIWVLAVLLFLFSRFFTTYGDLTRILLIASTSFFVIAIIQRKGFYYHYYPMGASAVLVLLLLIFNIVRDLKLIPGSAFSKISVTSFLVVCSLLFISGTKAVRSLQKADYPLLSPLVQIVKEHANGKPIFLFSSSVFPSFPLVNYSNAVWACRFNCLWFLPGLYSDISAEDKDFPYRIRDEMGVRERTLVDAVITDLLDARPTLLITDCSTVKQGFGETQFEYIEYFLFDPRFSKMWSKYTFLTNVGNYRVFKRTQDSGSLIDNV